MVGGQSLKSDDIDDRKRLFFSLAGAFFIASLGFALIFYFFAWLPYETLAWLDTLPQAQAVRILKMTTIFARTFSLFLAVVSPTIILVIVAQKQRSKQRHPIESTWKKIR